MSDVGAEPTTSERRGYFAVVILSPLLGASLGVNGGPVFQILAIESLGLDARQVGLAVGLGAISIPFQIMAARIPLRSAHRNLRVFIWLMSAMCLVMAWLIRGPVSASVVVATVIAVAVLAELAVSVLFATSFQPLLSTTVDSGFRQRLNAQGRAVGGLLAIGLVGLVSWAGTTGRIVILVALAMLGAIVAMAVSSLRNPQDESPSTLVPSNMSADERDGLTWVYVAIGISVIPAWPFVVTYASNSYWPLVNLGAIGAALTAGPLVAAAAWRPTAHGLVMRARAGGAVSLLCALALVPLNPARSGWVHGALVLVIVTTAAAAVTVLHMSLLEVAHQRSSTTSTVKVLTRLDIVASTSMQLGFLAGGYLIDFSIDSSWLVDPYQLSLIVGGASVVGALTQVKNGPVASS